MSISGDNQVNLENLQIKCFLYKYTPDFTQLPNTDSILASFQPFSIDLDDTKFFTKYDISGFMVSYSFEQNIDETTYGWSIELQDLALSFGTIDSNLKVPAPAGGTTTGLAFSSNPIHSMLSLAEYETNADNFVANGTLQSPIYNAKTNRGMQPASLTAQNTGVSSVLSTVPGLRLSDLIQEYDFISIFLYKNNTPITDITGQFVLNTNLQNNPLWFFNPDTTPNPLAPQGGLSPDTFQLKYETALISRMDVNGNPLFHNEINGFVMRKTINRSINQVDRIMLKGNGWTRLFGTTRRVIKSSLFENALYQQGQLIGAQAISATQTVFAGRPIQSIIQDLFDLVYKIDFNTVFNANTEDPSLNPFPLSSSNVFAPAATNPSGTLQTGQLSLIPSTIDTMQPTQLFTRLSNSFFNISSLIAANQFPANFFNLPEYLLAVTMKRRNFAYIEPINIAEFALNADQFTASLDGLTPAQFQAAIQAQSGQVLAYGRRQPVVYDANVQNLTAYFQFLADAYLTFAPESKTPYEIFDDIRANAFIELFELQNGQFFIRAPQYNNTNIYNPLTAYSDTNRYDISMVRSSDLNMVSTSYTKTVENLVSKVFIGNSIDFQPNTPPLQQFGYCDGKLLDQFGLMESAVSANPNVNLAKSGNSNNNTNQTNGLFEYVRYMLRILNAKLNVGTIVCDLDPRIQVGQTFLDETNFKFGYIININKTVSVAGTATMTISLSYVRDCDIEYGTSNSIQSVNVEILPVLADIENAFSGN